MDMHVVDMHAAEGVFPPFARDHHHHSHHTHNNHHFSHHQHHHNNHSHHTHSHLPLADFSRERENHHSDDNDPPFSDSPLSPKHQQHTHAQLKLDEDESEHEGTNNNHANNSVHVSPSSKQSLYNHHSELLDDFIGTSSSSSPVGSPAIRDSDEPHSIDLSPSAHQHLQQIQNGTNIAPIPLALPLGGTTVIDGVTYNNRGYEVCGALNKFNKPCQRIGRCPFHPDHKKMDPPPLPPAEGSAAPVASTALVVADTRRILPIKKGPYKSGWKKDEHLRFLKGLQIHGRGSWKDIALIVGTRTPTQIQVHAHRYYLRQQQGTKNKRSIHDISLEDLEELEVQHGSIMPVHSPLPQLPPSPPDNDNSTHDISHLFQSHHPNHSYPHHGHHTPANGHTSMNGNGHQHSHSHSHTSSPPSHSSSSSSSFSGSSSVSTNFPPLFSGSSSSPSLPGLLPLPLPTMPGGGSAPFSMNYHSSSAWFSASPFPSMNSLSSINIGDDNLAGLHLPPPADHKLLSPLASTFSHDDYGDDDGITDSDFTVAHHHSNGHNHINPNRHCEDEASSVGSDD